MILPNIPRTSMVLVPLILNYPWHMLEIFVYLVFPMLSDYFSPTSVLGILVWLETKQPCFLGWPIDPLPLISLNRVLVFVDVTAYVQSNQIFSKDNAPRWRVPHKKKSLVTSLPLKKLCGTTKAPNSTSFHINILKVTPTPRNSFVFLSNQKKTGLPFWWLDRSQLPPSKPFWPR